MPSRMPSGSSSMRNWALAGALYLTAALILRASLSMVGPLPLPVAHDHAIYHPDEVDPVQPHRVSAYCQCPICCGQWADGYTASGTLATEGRTAAADTFLWPMGTCLSIPGVGPRTVEDTGSAIKWRAIDVFMDDHERARRFGVRFVDVEEC